MNKSRSRLREIPCGDFCALSYRPRDPGEVLPLDEQIILAAIAMEEEGLHLLIAPNWGEIVSPADRNYLVALWEDLRERATSDPARLFKQLKSLGVGPLVTCESGSLSSDWPRLSKISSEFLQL